MCRHCIPRRQHQPLRAVFAKLAQLLVLEHAEGFAGVVIAQHGGGVEDVAQFVAGQAVEAGVIGVELGAQLGAALGGEGEWGAVVAQVARPAGQVVCGVGELEHARDDVGQVGFGAAVGGEDGELL